MTHVLNKLVVQDVDGQQHEFAGGGGEGTRPAPNSVGTAEIEDEGVKKEDLDRSIQDQLDVLSDENVVSEEELEDSWKEAMRQAGLPIDITEEAGSGSSSAEGGGDPDE